MAKSKYGDHQVRMQCSECGQVNYYTRRNKKKVENKLELNKFCNKCRVRKIHKERKK